MIIEDQNQNEHPLDEESNIEQEESIWTIGRKSKDHRKTGEKFKLPVLPLYFYKGLILAGLFCIALFIVGLLWLFDSSHSSYTSIAAFKFILSYAILYGVLLIYRPIESFFWTEIQHIELKNIDHLYNIGILTSTALLNSLMFLIIFSWADDRLNGKISNYAEGDDNLVNIVALIIFGFAPILVAWWAQKYRWRKRNKLSK